MTMTRSITIHPITRLGAALLAAAGLLAGLAAFQPAPAQAAGDCTVTAADLAVEGFEAQALTLVNQYRQAQNPPRAALQQSDALNRAAAWMSRDSANNDHDAGAKVDHPATDGRKIKERQESCGYPMGAFSQENLYWGVGTENGLDKTSAQAAFDWWKASPFGHNEAMLDPRHTFAGIARSCHQTSGKCYWSLELGAVAGAAGTGTGGGAAGTTSTQAYPVAVRCDITTEDDQHCDPPFTVTVETTNVLRVRLVANPQHCSDIHVSFFAEKVGALPFDTMRRSGGDFLKPGASSNEVDLSKGPGQYRVRVWAEGRPGGCNTGRLDRWEGTLYVTTSGAANATTPFEGMPGAGAGAGAAMNRPLLEQGAQGPAVSELQRLLGQQGCVVTVDGDFGPQTDRAVQAFQAGMDLAVDGVVGPQTWAALVQTTAAGAGAAMNRPVLEQGSCGPAVRELQRQLGQHGYQVAIDGDFGAQTLTAVRAFQKAKGLTVDGVVGPQTWGALSQPPVPGLRRPEL
jgi:peptidoglycan hydrolase-like protein with peptidoglycan-binding domain/uncharacterized protein YkwD